MIIHGHKPKGKPSKTYNTWTSMKKRCLNKDCKDYKDYGAIGVIICERWMIFENFLEDMGCRPDGMTLDRINNSKIYSKETCKWSTISQQNANKLAKGELSIKGIRPTKSGKFEARIKINGENIHLGTFPELSLAINAFNKKHEAHYV